MDERRAGARTDQSQLEPKGAGPSIAYRLQDVTCPQLWPE